MRFELSIILLCALLAISVSWTRSPFMALMFSVMLFINASIVLLMLGFEFLALVNILVYVGALAVLFLFVVMLLEIPSTELRAYHRGWSTLALFGAISCSFLRFFFSYGFGNSNLSYKESFMWADPSAVSSVYSLKSGAVSMPLLDSWTSLQCTPAFVPTLESISAVGHAFYIRYADLLILNSLVLTIALFGALVLAHTKN
mmetsp:Transcript_3672/g.7925  ORF Transcript_3672/g.7925 Transcript_3672/m.7925 type:complete len:201 (-) Transcript_3672:40-642(-)